MYLVVNFELYKDSTPVRKSIKDFGTENEAMVQWHGELKSARSDSNCSYFLCVVMESTGRVVCLETYSSEKYSPEK